MSYFVMPKYTRDELEKMLADLDKDENEEVWIKDGGREYKVSGRRATSLLDKLLGTGDDSDDAAEDSEDIPAEDAVKSSTAAKYFGGKKAM